MVKSQGSERYGKGIIICHVRNREMNESEPLMKCRNLLNDVKTRGSFVTWDKSIGSLFTG
ncbi:MULTISPECIES: hypothetical protein [unclassified Wolbachia]|uniref:hypothetical protein n=1 Tax=unclassified Wolbachia TaxID=2640676 RepID=UPI00131EFE62|nr:MULTISPECIES: hypothetical protein [unclassified Wolbachia]